MLAACLVLAALLLVNGILAMSELAIMTSRASRLERDARRGSKGAASALALAREPTRFLSTVQVGITLIGIFSGAFGEKALAAPLREMLGTFESIKPIADEISLAIVVTLITYVSLVFGELVPKRIAMAYPESSAAIIAQPLQLLSTLGAIPVRLLSASTDLVLRLLQIRQKRDDVSEEDVKALVDRAATSGALEPAEHELFQRALAIGDRKAKALMVPRNDVVWIGESMTTDEVRILLGTSPYSHFPICRDSFDQLVGVVHIKDLIAYGLLGGSNFVVATVAQPPIFVPDTAPALKILEIFQAERTHIAFVVDEYGSVEGIVTLNDIMRTLVGDVGRRGEDAAPQAVRRADGSWLVDSMLPVTDLIRIAGLQLEHDHAQSDVSTVGGLVIHLAGRIPEVGAIVSWEGLRFEVVDMDGHRIDQVLVSREATGESESGAD
ncbi:MAG: HlyC/CorC family transporter [Phycisphaerae bacterium]|jgi:putative hemolysin|nr:HlyC/CorC family transporter [Phycisphaerae bacterium]